MQVERENLAEEILLREYIRKAIKIIKNKRKNTQQEKIKEEKELRILIRKAILNEAKKVPKWESYGKNNLDVMLMKTNFLDALETGYKSLTTTNIQRTSYMKHITQNVKKTLNLEKAKEVPGGQTHQELELNEEEEINLTLDGGELMGLSPEEEKEKEKNSDLENFKIPDEDYSGLSEAHEAFNMIEDTLLTYWRKMDLDEDRDIFYDNLMEQLNLYFEKWEGEVPDPSRQDDLGGSLDKPPLPEYPGGPISKRYTLQPRINDTA